MNVNYSVQSDLDKGITFYFDFPIQQNKKICVNPFNPPNPCSTYQNLVSNINIKAMPATTPEINRFHSRCFTFNTLIIK